MTKIAYQGVLPLAFAIGFAACDGQPPSRPTPPPPPAPSAPTVTAISPSTGSTARPTPVMISGTGFLAGATVTVEVMAMSVTVVSSTTITAVIPAHSVGQADVVVTNPSGSAGTLSAGFTYSFDEPFALTPSTNAVDAGGQMSVSWTAPGAQAGDWIAVFPVGGSYDDDWWGPTSGATSGTHILNAPTRPGQYEFRYLLVGGFVDAARSSPVTVR
jgi:IPT/TIG domain